MKFSLTEYPLPNGTVVEASAGTGKTFSVAAHVTLAIASVEDLRIGEILITTFTRNAAAELRDRVRVRMLATAQLLREGASATNDDLDLHLLAGTAADRLARARRLERAVAEFDTATVATIHGVCSKVLKAAGVPVGEAGDDDLRRRIVAEVVNDHLLAEALTGTSWDERHITAAVHTLLGDPFLVPWFDDGTNEPPERERLVAAQALLTRCVEGVRAAMRSTPSYDDLLRIAWEVVRDPANATLRDDLRRRFKLAIIDEAQDTSRLQWEFFHELFPPADSRPLIAVGDPKQAIYGFRGADVQAYLRFSQPASGKRPRRTLDTNRRSDGPILDTLNTILPHASFGVGIAYHPVQPAPENLAPRIGGMPPVEFIDLGDRPLVDAAARKVWELLDVARVDPAARRVKPDDICVLVRTNTIGGAIERRLAAVGIRAVSTGTASVMDSGMAADLRALLEAIERPSSPGRVRRLAATRFFGHEITAVATLEESQELAIQERIGQLGATLRTRGIAACLAELASDNPLMRQVTAGDEGERNITDLGHLTELLHASSGGRAVTATEILEQLAELEHRDERSDLVSRRIESDEDAVRIMTIHAAKGLEFPCVVIADTWKPKDRVDRGAVFYDGDERRLDITCVDPDLSPSVVAASAALDAQNEELERLLYVALTRAKHHLCVLVSTTNKNGKSLLTPLLAEGPAMRQAATLPPLPAGCAPAAPASAAAGLAPLVPVGQSYARTSFSGVIDRWKRTACDPFERPGGGTDEDGFDRPAIGVDDDGGGVIELPAGTAVGTVVHEIFEAIDTSCVDRGISLEDEVRRVVSRVAATGQLAGYHESLGSMVTAALRTPFGGPSGTVFRDVCFADIRPTDRLAEMRFEMALPLAGSGLMASAIGRLLVRALPPGDPLGPYAESLADRSFDIPLAGLINGSVDAVLRLPGFPPAAPRLVIADYKSNKLHDRVALNPLAAYEPARLVEAMGQSHYILQAILYGIAVYRLIRWRLPDSDADGCIAGIVYAFIRGTQGPDTPTDEAGRRYGMFTWQPPRGLWSALSGLLAGDDPGGRR